MSTVKTLDEIPEDVRRHIEAKEAEIEGNVVSVEDPSVPQDVRENFSVRQEPSYYGSITAGLNRGIAEMVGFLPDIGQGIYNTLSGESKPAFLGSEYIQKQVLNPLGIETSLDQDARNVYKRGAGRVAEELGAMLVPIPGISGIRAGAKVAPEVAGEVTRATLAGAGGFAGQELDPDNPYMELTGQVLGGFSPDAAKLVGKGAAYTGKRIGPVTPGKAERAVGGVLRGIVEESPNALNNLDEALRLQREYGVGFSLPQATGDPYTISTYRSMRAKDVKLTQKDALMRERNKEIINQALEEIGPASDVTEFQKSIREISDLETRLGDVAARDARIIAEESVSKITPVYNEPRIGRALRDLQEGQVSNWKVSADEAYAKVDPQNKIDLNATSLREKADLIIKDNMPPYGNPENVPQAVYDVKNAKPKEGDDVIRFEELRKLRSRIMDDRRMERGGQNPNPNKLRYLKELQGEVEGTLNTLNTKEYREASKIWREGKEKYGQGATRKSLQQGMHGEQYRIASTDVPSLYFHSGKSSYEDASEFLKKFGNDKEAMNLMDDYIKNQLVSATGGNITSRRLESFKNKHKNALSVFKGMDSKLDGLLKESRYAEDLKKKTEITSREVDKNLVKLYLDADPDKLVPTILNGNSPIKDFRKAWNTVKGDKAAEDGLRAGFHDYMKANWNTPYSINKFRSRYKELYDLVYTPDQIKSISDLENIVSISQRDVKEVLPGGSDTAAKFEQDKRALGAILSRLYGIERGVISSGWVMREQAARIGYGLIGKLSRDMTQTVMDKAYTDPSFAKLLMTRLSNKNLKGISEKIRRHLVNSFAVSDIAEPEMQQ